MLVDASAASQSLCACWLPLRDRVDRREAPDLLWYHRQSVLERGERAPGPAGLLHTRLETPDADGDGALHRRHRRLVVRRTSGGVSALRADGKYLSVLPLSAFRWLPESARWLLANGRVEEAKKYLDRCAKMNKKNTSKLDTEV